MRPRAWSFPSSSCPTWPRGLTFKTAILRSSTRKRGLGLRVLDPEQDYKRTSSFIRTLINRNASRRQRAEEKRLLYVACTRARDHLLLGGALTDKHFATDLDAAMDCLGWICGSLALTEGDLAQGSARRLQACHPLLPIHTDPNAFPVPTTTDHQAEPAFRALDAAPTHKQQNRRWICYHRSTPPKTGPNFPPASWSSSPRIRPHTIANMCWVCRHGPSTK